MARRWTIATVALWWAACQGPAPGASGDLGAGRIGVSITIAGPGAGHVTSTPPGIDCPAACTATFAAGTQVSLAAAPDATSAFAGWAGDCSGYDSCTISHTTALSASFAQAKPILVVPVATEMASVRLTADPMRVFIRQWVRFEARVNGVPKGRIAWSVQEGEPGGVVGDDGTYTAPSTAGEYHVVAISRDDPAERGSVTVEVATTQDVYDYGGPVLAAANVHLLWWGAPEQFGGAVDLFHAFLAGADGSRWLEVLGQYLRGERAQVSLVGEIFDPSPQPPGRIPDPGAKICSLLGSERVQPDAGTIYALVVASPMGTFNYHATAVCEGVQLPILVLSLPEKGGAYVGACSGRITAAERLLWAFSHELAETMTDPVPATGWTDVFGQEIADACADATCEVLATGAFSLNPVFSNSARRCAP